MENGSYLFDAVIRSRTIRDIRLNMGGLHNVENAIAAIAVGNQLEIEEGKLKAAIASFSGVKRRFEYVVKTATDVMIDDYAHHPEELRALIISAKKLFPGKTCTVVFQPHLYSRTNDLADGFAEVLSLADETILLPIYPARELPMHGVSSKMILDRMSNEKKSIKEKDELLRWIKENRTELLITSGAGDIDTLVEPIKEIIINRK
jgi:UDP-N-acetylmuramate--alanine ligase